MGWISEFIKGENEMGSLKQKCADAIRGARGIGFPSPPACRDIAGRGWPLPDTSPLHIQWTQRLYAR